MPPESMSGDRDEAERRTEAAFAAGSYRDPRADYRAHLRALRARDVRAFERAVGAYEELVRSIVEGADPEREWLRYGSRLARETPGRTVGVDVEGRAEPWHEPVGHERAGRPHLVLHLPEDGRQPAWPLAVPRSPSAAQAASLALLVEGRQELVD